MNSVFHTPHTESGPLLLQRESQCPVLATAWFSNGELVVSFQPQEFEDCFGVFQPSGPLRLAAKWTVLVLRSDRDAPLTRVVVGCLSEWEARLLRETLLRARQLTYPCVPMRAQEAEESEKCEDSASDQECPSRKPQVRRGTFWY